MRFLTKAESLRTLIDLPAAGSDAGDGSAEIQVNLERDLGRSAAIARPFVRLIGTGQTAFLWIREFGIWPSLENWPLFESLRRDSHGVRPLHEAPGHVFAADEQEALMSGIM